MILFILHETFTIETIVFSEERFVTLSTLYFYRYNLDSHLYAQQAKGWLMVLYKTGIQALL